MMKPIFVYLVVMRLNDAKQWLFFSMLKGEYSSILSIIHQLRQYWIEQTSRRASYAFLKNILVNQKTGCCPFIPAIQPTSNIRIALFIILYLRTLRKEDYSSI